MVSQVTSLSRNGVSDWVIQRVSALVLATYTLWVFGFVVLNPGMDFATWSGLFNNTGMQVFTMLAVLSTAAHAWIGMWTIGSDYLREHTLGPRAATLRFIYQIGCVLIIAVYLIWGINILWGNN
jgi:succinate dehydrogenase / fumarate reductase membrane anchor subunit|tara:strand:+ start:6122 stop:6493 length:372 start_codon:yes stop_codon:yes gene_type:complete